MYYRFSLALLVFFVMLSTATPGQAACDPTKIAGTWYMQVQWVEEDGVTHGWSDCVVKLNAKGKIKSVSCSEFELGDTTLSPRQPLAVTGSFNLLASCRITGKLIEDDESSEIRGSVSRNYQVMNGVFYEEGEFNGLNTFTALKK